ncbi:unnamed protein product [Dibothriocephalus latus]|uniref:Uncharacterized protein n=1 Tax=Dibothriocephalus latus TaxID=60516 RepID=A0A3P7N2A6_DIBLA|nr:unnamed protein product [Dibothriocephalus latus]
MNNPGAFALSPDSVNRKLAYPTGLYVCPFNSHPSRLLLLEPELKNNANSQLLVGSAITLKPAARTELTHWCESQLSVFPRHNVDLPTLISLLCDIEEADDVLECIEASFGKSSRLSKFSKAFVEKRATLMRSTA